MRTARLTIEDIMQEEGHVDILEPDDAIGFPSSYVMVNYNQADVSEDTLASYFAENADSVSWLRSTLS